MEAAKNFNAPVMVGLSEGEKICRIKDRPLL